MTAVLDQNSPSQAHRNVDKLDGDSRLVLEGPVEEEVVGLTEMDDLLIVLGVLESDQRGYGPRGTISIEDYQ